MIKLPNIKGLMTIGKAAVAAHRPEILFGASVASTLGAVVMAAKGGYESGRKIEQIETAELRVIPVKEKIQLTWLNYLPAAGLTAGALGATTGLHLVHISEKKAIAAAALMAIDEIKNEANDYKEQVLEIVSDDKKTHEEKKEEVEEVSNRVFNTDGELSELYLIRCPITGRDIWSNKARIEEAMVEVGNCMNASSMASLNTFWEQAGWGRLEGLGEELGWSGVIPAISWHDQFHRPIAGVRDDGRPWRGFRFLPEPEKGYEDN